MRKWNHTVGSLTRVAIQWAINHDEWQKFRLSLKGISTEDKLKRLDDWLVNNRGGEKTTVQVDNYINALKRGGQLNGRLEVVR